jgi:MSHA biogenesis protein MshL
MLFKLFSVWWLHMTIKSLLKMSQSTVSTVLLCTIVLFGLTGCDLMRNQLKPDRGANMEIQDFRDGLASRMDEEEESADPFDNTSIPDLQPYIAENTGEIKPMPLVSIAVNQSIPLRDVLYELADQADYDLELDPSIRGSIIFTAREKPFDLVIQRIAEMAGLRYRFLDEVLRVEVDKPYNYTYGSVCCFR